MQPDCPSVDVVDPLIQIASFVMDPQLWAFFPGHFGLRAEEKCVDGIRVVDCFMNSDQGINADKVPTNPYLTLTLPPLLPSLPPLTPSFLSFSPLPPLLSFSPLPPSLSSLPPSLPPLPPSHPSLSTLNNHLRPKTIVLREIQILDSKQRMRFSTWQATMMPYPPHLVVNSRWRVAL